MKIKIGIWLLVFGLFMPNQSKAVSDTLYINGGNISFHPLGFNAFPFLAFNESAAFKRNNKFLEFNRNQQIDLTIINNDSLAHTILIDNGQYSTGTLQPGFSATLSMMFNTNGLYDVIDSAEEGRVLGLSTFIKIWDNTNNNFYWNLNELQSDLNDIISQGIAFDLDSFNPDYFTINGNAHPEISNDTLAKVTGQVGDSIYIFVFNSGKMYHAIHFHGYHVKIIGSSSNVMDIGRLKDSIPIKPNSYQVYLLIPNQEGQFPVHDHNLVATTGGGNYPNGMMVMMHISP